MAGLEKGELPEASQTIRHFGMVRPKRFLQDCQGLTVERFGRCVAALECMNVSQIVQAAGNFRMLGCQRFQNGQSALRKAFHFPILLLVQTQPCQVAQGCGEFQTVGEFFPDVQGPPVEWIGFTQPPARVI